MMKLSFLLPLLFIIFSSCATMEEVADDADVSADTDTAQAEDPKPDWYDYSNRFYADSLSFTGVGLSAAPDPNSARDEAVKQSIAHLKLAIDFFLEEIRSELSEQNGREEFNTTDFILSLRNAIQELSIEDELEMTEEHIEKPDSVHHIYIKTEITRESAIKALHDQLDNRDFFRAMNEESAR